MTDERWLPVPGHENYAVSDHGRVRREKPGRGAKVGRVISAYPNREDGYYRVKLSGGPRGVVTYYVHRLVAMAFLPQCDLFHVDRVEVHHKDNDLEHNHISNLEWVTPSTNKTHAWVTRRRRNKLADPAPWEEVA